MKHDDDWGSFTSSLVHESSINAKVEAAVFAERERCAKIAEDWRGPSEYGPDWICQDIAAAIRSGKVLTKEKDENQTKVRDC